MTVYKQDLLWHLWEFVKFDVLAFRSRFKGETEKQNTVPFACQPSRALNQTGISSYLN